MNWCPVRRELQIMDTDRWRVYGALNLSSWLIGFRFGSSSFDAWVVIEAGPLSLVVTRYSDDEMAELDAH